MEASLNKTNPEFVADKLALGLTGSNPVLDTDTRGNRKHTRHCLGNGNKHTEYLSLVGKH